MTIETLTGLDDSQLCAASEQQPNHRLTPLTSQAFQLMAASAKQDQIDITIASSFRNFERQALIWNEKFTGIRPVLNRDGAPIKNWQSLPAEDRIRAILRWSALPGASRHHWGTDLDVYSAPMLPDGYKLQLLPSEYDRRHGCFQTLTRWLDEHMAEFGFFRPFAKDTGGVAIEPWHISYRPESQQFAHSFSVITLATVLSTHPIEGVDTILTMLPEIWDCYIQPVTEGHSA